MITGYSRRLRAEYSAAQCPAILVAVAITSDFKVTAKTALRVCLQNAMQIEHQFPEGDQPIHIGFPTEQQTMIHI